MRKSLSTSSIMISSAIKNTKNCLNLDFTKLLMAGMIITCTSILSAGAQAEKTSQLVTTQSNPSLISTKIVWQA